MISSNESRLEYCKENVAEMLTNQIEEKDSKECLKKKLNNFQISPGSF